MKNCEISNSEVKKDLKFSYFQTNIGTSASAIDFVNDPFFSLFK